MNLFYEPTMTQSPESQTALFKALVSFVAETKDIVADDYNPHFKNKFASLSKHLEVIKPIAKKHGLAIIQLPVGGYDNAVGVRTIVIHEQGGSIQSDAVIPCAVGMNGQNAGSLYSYIRRYALASIAGVATEDDDAEFDRVVKTQSKPMSAPKAQASAPASAPVASKSSASGNVAPFGDAKGVALSALPIMSDDKSKKCADLNYWANVWQPRPFGDTGKISAKDLATKAEAQRLWAEANGNSDSEPSSEDVPF
jgi:hypothetical protein